MTTTEHPEPRPALGDVRVPKAFTERVPRKMARESGFVAISLEEREALNRFRIATHRPHDVQALDNLSHLLAAEIVPVEASKDDVERVIDHAYHERAAGVESIADDLDVNAADLSELARTGDDDVLELDDKAPLVKIVNATILEAVRKRASDIHIQPKEDQVRIRLRIDGWLYTFARLHRDLLEGLVSRIKVMGGMDIAERRLPQDGGHLLRIGRREIDLRIATLPSDTGERVTIRLQDKSSGVRELGGLGLLNEQRAQLEELIRSSHGIVFVTGPTGSGKTTTLYAALTEINSDEKNIITLENPVEYHLPGISQTEVAERKGLTFASGLRSILRQDPDVIMVGEVRDQETAKVAIQAALTGHLVFSTLHTNDAPGAITRLIDIGIEPYLVSSSLNAAIAQRLVRSLCIECRVFEDPTPDERHQLERAGIEASQVAHATGCPRCMNTGYYGRSALYEILVVDDEIRERILARESSSSIRRFATERGWIPIAQHGLREVAAGRTTFEEVKRITLAPSA